MGQGLIQEKDRAYLLGVIGSELGFEYFVNKTNLGKIDNAETFEYKGACSEAMKLYVKIDNEVIRDVRFQYKGCSGLACCGSALCEIIKGKTLQEAKEVTSEDILEHLKAKPIKELDCPLLTVETLRKTIELYQKNQIGK